MQEPLFTDVADSVGFDARDAANVRSLGRELEAVIPTVAGRVYERLVQHDEAVSVLAGGEQQIEHLRATLAGWLEELLERRHEKEDYRERQRRIGAARVRAGVPLQHIVTGIELVWQELSRCIRDTDIPDRDQKLTSLHKLLMVDLAIMLEDYKQSYTEKIRGLERSVVEEKLTRAEHLAEIGQLAASLAHEIKNPLAGISGAVQIIRDAMAPDDPHHPVVTEILGQIKRLDATVKDLLQYARPTPPRARKVALGEVVSRVLTVLRKEPDIQCVQITYDPAPAGTVVHADEAQMEQLLINLILNAAHASEDNGVIHLGVTGDLDEVKLIVRDEGAGMSPDVRKRAFEPFFTTRARGTGLGLTICRRIAEVHGGDIELQTELGKGTTVTVSLPINHKEHHAVYHSEKHRTTP